MGFSGRAQRPFRSRQEVFLSHAIVSCSGLCDRSANSYGKFKFAGRFVIVELLHISIAEHRNLYYSLASRKKIMYESILRRSFKLSCELIVFLKHVSKDKFLIIFVIILLRKNERNYAKYILFFFFKLYKYLFNKFTVILEPNTI